MRSWARRSEGRGWFRPVMPVVLALVFAAACLARVGRCCGFLLREKRRGDDKQLSFFVLLPYIFLIKMLSLSKRLRGRILRGG